jgi:hypothetical protein
MCALLLFAFAAHADDVAESSAAVSTASESSFTPSNVTKNIYSDFSTQYYGPSLQKFGPYSYNGKGYIDPSALSGFDSETHLAYMLDPDRLIAVGPDMPFYYQPNLQGRVFVLGDVGIKMFDKKTIKTGHFQLGTSLYLQAPTSLYAQSVREDFAIESEPWFYYDIGSSRWRVGSWSEFRYLDHVNVGLNIELYAEPYISYRLTDKFSLSLTLETEADHDAGNAPGNFHNVMLDLQPGFVWTPTPRTRINPYLVFFPSDPLATRTTSIGMVFFQQFM